MTPVAKQTKTHHRRFLGILIFFTPQINALLKNIIVTPPPPPPPFPLSFFGGGGGTIAPPPRRGGDEVPPPSPSGFYKNFFTQGRLIWNILLFSLSLYSLCVIYPRGRSSVHSSKLQKLMVSSQKFIVAYFNEI